jgi:hypothetical protein
MFQTLRYTPIVARHVPLSARRVFFMLDSSKERNQCRIFRTPRPSLHPSSQYGRLISYIPGVRLELFAELLDDTLLFLYGVGVLKSFEMRSSSVNYILILSYTLHHFTMLPWSIGK